MLNKRSLIVAPALLIAALGCEEKSPPAPPPPASPGPKASAPLMAPGPATGVAGVTASNPASTSSPSGGGSVKALGLEFPVPAGWIQVPPANSMRLAELQLPDASGDPSAACSVVFSSAGGDVAGNIERWAGQVRDATGQPSKPAIQTRTVADLPVTTAEMSGTYTAMGGSPHSNWTLRGAIIQTPSGLLFIKMTGPAEAVAKAGDAFNAMIDGLKKP